MRPIALARVRLSGAAQNVCGISAQTFAVKGGAPGEDQVVGWVDHITLLDGCVLVERDEKPDELLPLSCIATMRPFEDLKVDLLGEDEARQRAEEAKAKEEARAAFEAAQAARAVARADARKQPAPPAASMRDDDGDVLRPEAAITHAPVPTSAPVSDEAPAKRGRKKRN